MHKKQIHFNISLRTSFKTKFVTVKAYEFNYFKNYFEERLPLYQNKKHPLEILIISKYLHCSYIFKSNCFCHSAEYMNLGNLLLINSTHKVKMMFFQKSLSEILENESVFLDLRWVHLNVKLFHTCLVKNI